MMNRNQFRWLLVRRALLHKRGKAVLIVLAVMMGASVVTALLNLESDLRSRMNRELRDYGPNVVLTPFAEGGVLQQEILSSLRSERLNSMIIAYTPQLFLPGRASAHSFLIVGADLDGLRKIYPGWEWVNFSGKSKDTAFAGVQLAKRLQLKPGSELDFKIGEQTHSVRIAGTLQGGESEDDQLWLPLEEAQILGGRSNQMDLVAISAVGEIAEVERVFSEVVKNLPGVRHRTIRKIAAAETLILDRISRLMALVIAIILVILFFCIHTTVSAILISRQREIALVRALGARRKQIMSGFTLELLSIALLGGVAGFLLGIGVAQILGHVLFRTLILPRLDVFLITIFSSLAMMIVSSFFPIRRAINQQAAVILKEV